MAHTLSLGKYENSITGHSKINIGGLQKMSCKDLIPGDFGCASSKGPTLEIASEAIKIDLSKPINISGMSVLIVEFVPSEDRYGKKWLATAELGGWVTNEEGEEEKLEIIIKRTSNRRPKLPGE